MKEIEVGTFEAKNRLSALIDEAAKGQRIWITRRGKRVALLLSADDFPESGKKRPDDLLSSFRSIRRSAKRGPESLKSLVEEGRR